MNIFTYAFCFFLYQYGRTRGTGHERLTGHPVYDFWLGGKECRGMGLPPSRPVAFFK
jgi:hypothetical protein